MAAPPKSKPGASLPPAARAKYLAGDVVDAKYRLTSVLGEGGMGSVWLARNITLDVDVALKLIRRDSATPEAGARLLREARAAAQLEHSSIVRVYDFGTTEHDDPFIVMEVLRGKSLANLLQRRGRLPAADAVATLLPVASALAAAHARGVIHRDLKPDNIVLIPSGAGPVVPKVVDFGIAKRTRPELKAHFTQTGAVMGSPEYMSPEQARGRADVDERTDVWAMCVVLYETIAGRRPFEGANYNALLNAIIEEIPPPTTEYAAGDDELWRIIEHGLAKSPDDRWESMRALGRALASWAVDRGVATDVAGTALALHWLHPGAPISLSDLPSIDRVSRTSGVEQDAGAAARQSGPGGRTSTDLVPTVRVVPYSHFHRRRPPWIGVATAAVVLTIGALLAQHVVATRPEVPLQGAQPVLVVPPPVAAPVASQAAPPSPSPSSPPPAVRAPAPAPPGPTGTARAHALPVPRPLPTSDTLSPMATP